MNTSRTSLLNRIDPSFRKTKMSLAVAATSLLAACGGGAGTPETGAESGAGNVVSDNTELANQVETIVEGAAIKGAIENGIVRAYLVEEQNGLLVPNDQPLASSVRTDSNGNYSLVLDEQLNDATVVIEITADELTTMKCDVTSGCSSNSLGRDIEFGDRFSLSRDFSLKSIVTSVNGGDDVSISVSPLTHMAVAKLDGMITGYTEQNIASVFADIENLFGLDSGALNITPADITRIEAYSELTSAELEMGLISASILDLVSGSGQGSIEDVLAELEASFRDNGGLAAQSEVEGEITVEDVLNSASNIAVDLVQVLPDSTHSDELGVAAASIASSYDDVTSEDLVLAVITQHPQNVTVEEGATINLSVVGSGDQIEYQWRKNEVVISGANASSFQIEMSSLSDAGEYDVLLSNPAGVVTSLSALVIVNELVVDDSNDGSDTSGGSDNSGTDGSDTSGGSDNSGNDGSDTSGGSDNSGNDGSDTSGGSDNSGNDGSDLFVDPVTIVSSPTSVSVGEGEEAILSVAVSGEGTISYQWRKDGVEIDGEVSNTLVIAGASASDAGQYDVQVTNEAGTVTSAVANVEVDVIELVQIVSSPASESATVGADTQLSVVVSGEGTINYQWRKDGLELVGETTNSLSLTSVQLADSGTYDVVVTNEAGSVVSNGAVLTVEPATFDVTLSWDAPLQRTDGADIELYEINGYKIAYGTAEDELTNQVTINDENETSYLLTDLEAGTYFFSVATVDTDGVESDYTAVIEISL